MDDLLATVRAKLPLALRGARVSVAHRAAVGLGLVVALAVALAVAFAVHGRAQPATLSAASYPDSTARTSTDRASGASSAYGASAAPVASAASAGASAARQIVVDVEGRVHLPGVHAVASTARIQDVITAAGGALPGVDLTDLDLAQRVSDGQQIRVGLPGAPAAGSGAGSSGTGGASGGSDASPDPSDPVDINVADAGQLDALPGIGPALAARIIAWRTAHGDFATVQDLGQVPGLGGKKLATLAPLVRV